MKKLVLSLLIILFVVNGFAQNNVNVDNYRFNFTYRALPSKPLAPMFFYYGTRINVPNSVARVIDMDALYDQLRIEGQRRTDDAKPGDVAVNLDMGFVEIVSSDVKEREGDSKDKDGQKRGRDKDNKYYWMVITYTFESKVVVTKNGKNIEYYPLYYRINTLTYQTREFSSRRDLSEYWKNNRENLKEAFARDLATSSVNRATARISSLYGFPTTKSSDIIKTINEKKHPENTPFRAAGDDLKSKLEMMNANTPMMEEDVAGLIDYYMGILDRYTDPKLNADIRLRYAALYNLCKIYLYLEQPENIKQYADLILENGYDKGDSKKMNEAAQKLTGLFNSSNIIKTRHFDPDIFFED
ncbi:hypothetical protein [Dysgonomonas alginatilytica]|nr:hypothetical protein [Dysgonomonas alginatilytica]